jgi:iron complex transport system substrate-binding protein
MRQISSPATTRTAAAAVLSATAAVLVACGGQVTSDAHDSSSGETVRITNCGRELVFPKAPKRVVGLMPTQTDLLVRLGAADELVGQAQTAVSTLPIDIADQVRGVPVLSEDSPPARESLLAVQPDLVVSPTTYEFTASQGFADLDQLARSGAAAYVATGGCADRRNVAQVSDVLTDIRNLGEILGHRETAVRLSDEAERRLAAVTAAIEGRPRPTVAQVYVEGNSLSAIGAGVEADIIKRAGGSNVFDPDSDEFSSFFAAQINPEEIVSRAPEVIVFGVTDRAHEQQTRNYLARTFPDVPAVRHGRVIALSESDLHPGTLGNIAAVEAVARGLHPNAF